MEMVDTGIRVPEVAFTGDTTSSLFLDEANKDVLHAKLLIMECTFIDDAKTVEEANKNDHIHLKEILEHEERFKNEKIFLSHFSARYIRMAISKAVEKIPPPLRGRVSALIKGFRRGHSQEQGLVSSGTTR